MTSRREKRRQKREKKRVEKKEEEVEEEIKNLNQENNELKVKYNELKLKFVKAEREKESDEYEYGNRQEVKKKIELRLDVKNQSAYDAQVTLSNMDFPKDMEYLRNH
ncbi:hypothetical protein RhiirA5_423224 [Rhizophagus irregularis]|uniref:Uncharacterized protein n=2 Tax=Rhizophagus irregularis TaxID=588596 RepID=A0A2N0PAE8_9GLOM|nr:hypothetical protein RhiirA5_423224 [Rhizophagus irregularis]PKC63535.1 hypothetical protein RhiirA1_463631 [Rhizophagus irregularis]